MPFGARNNTKMSVSLKKLFRAGWQIARQTVWKEAAPQPKRPKLYGLDLRNNYSPKCANPFGNLLVPKKLPGIHIPSVWESLSTHLRKDAVRRLYSPMKSGSRYQGATKSYIPYLAYGFVGLILADHGLTEISSDDTDNLDDFCDALNCKEQKDIQRRNEEVDDVQYANNLAGYEFGKLIGRGCYGATYSAKTIEPETKSDSDRTSDVDDDVDDDDTAMQDRCETEAESESWDFISQDEKMDVDDSDCLSSISSNWSVMGSSSEFVSASHQVGQPPISDEESPGSMSNGVHKTPPVREDKAVDVEQKGSEKLATDGHFNLAIKFIFNDKVQSDASAIEAHFKSETIVLRQKLKPRNHPNIVKAHGSFAADNILCNFKEAHELFPRALQRDRFKGGHGRNMLLVLVMHRYQMTLREYIRSHPCRTEFEAQVMVCQLLEGVAFLNTCNIVHKDLKEDNVLVEVDSCGMPRLAITDFGCSSEFGGDSLQISCPWFEVSVDGNEALRAPEIKSALKRRRWPHTLQLNYRKSDAWAIGSLAYQICGMENPFYGKWMDSLSYNDRMLPPLPGFVSADFRLVIWGLLKKDPSERFSAAVAANMCHLLLWKPDHWDRGPASLGKMTLLESNLQNWLKQVMSLDINAGSGSSTVKSELLATFRSRVKRNGLLKAANVLIIERWLRWFQAETERMRQLHIIIA